MVLRRPVVLATASVLVLGGAAMAAPAAADGDGAGRPAADASADDVAIAYVRAHADELGVSASDVSDLFVMSSYPSRHTGVTHVNLNQRYLGREVFGGHVTVNVTAEGEVLHVGSDLVGGLTTGITTARAGLDAPDAVEAAAEGLELDEPAGVRILTGTTAGGDVTVLSGGDVSDSPITAKLGWQATGDALRPAWQVVIDDTSSPSLWNATVDAESGDLLEVDDWTTYSSTEGLATLVARPGASAAATAGEVPSGATVFESANPVQDGSSYRVFPQESPDDGDRFLSVEPADGTASPFGWHDVSGTAEPDYTITRGNNVHAYTDRDANNQPDPGSEPDGGPGLTFDFPMDLNEHPQANVDANLTNLFWWCNITHDLFYLYGFDEPAGNFQVNNYGRGGVGGDDVRCEGMDGVGHNNANFSTPAADGGRPRMQTMIELGSGLPSAVTVDSGPAGGTYLAHYARFTPPATTAGISGDLVLVDDGEGNRNDGCTPYDLPAGAIAVVDTNPGTCNNYTQVSNAEAAGAVAVVVVHTSNNPTFMSGSMDPPVGIPAVMVGLSNGNTIKAAIADSPAPGSVHRNADRPPMRVGELDTATILHEYGHGLSLRLTGGPGINCLTGQEQMGEGWSDFVAIAALIDIELDDPEGPRGIFPYVIYQPPRADFGLRPAPYSRNMEIQPFTYDSIKTGGWLRNAAGNPTSLSAPHGIGHGWAAVLWDLTWDLIDRHGFNHNLYDPWDTGGNNLAYQLVIDGLKLQGCQPGFVDGRDAILAADEVLTGGDNACTIWASFARRGLGYSAEQGTSANRNDNDEAFDTHPDCWNGFSGPVADQPALNTVAAGRTVPMRFSRPGRTGLDVLASNSPYSRQVNCETLATEIPGQEFITPGALPVAADTPGSGGLTTNGGGNYQFPWQTEEEWVDTCREFVLTVDDGQQHRAYFEFVEAE